MLKTQAIAYVPNGGKLQFFRQPQYLEAGRQVFAGVVGGEEAETAVIGQSINFELPKVSLPAEMSSLPGKQGVQLERLIIDSE